MAAWKGTPMTSSSLARQNVFAYWSRKWNRVRLFCYPLGVVIAIRVVGTLWIYHDMVTPASGFHFAWLEVNRNLLPAGSRWLFLFNGGDSFMFPIIAMFGYAHGRYPFLPGYPILIRFAGLLVGDYWFGAFLVTQAFALGSFVMFQLLAEQYMHPSEALFATLLMATFPYISVFTTLGYSEAMFLFSTISTWYFYRKDRLLISSVLAGVASVTRIYGVAIALPILLDIVRSRRYRKLLYLLIPLAFIGSWLLYCYLSTGDPLASWTQEHTVYAVVGANFGLGQTVWAQLSGGPGAWGTGGFDPAVLIAFVLFVFLTVRVWEIDRLLWVYPVAVFSLLTFVVASHITLLRYMAFIFPIWLTAKTRNPLAVAICLAFFIPVSLLLWLYAITVFFVG